MSRFRKKSKVKGNTSADSEKENKLEPNRKLRRVTKQKIKDNPDKLPELREISDKGGVDKDGKYLTPIWRIRILGSNKLLRKAKKGLIQIFNNWKYQPDIEIIKLKAPDYFNLGKHRYFYY